MLIGALASFALGFAIVFSRVSNARLSEYSNPRFATLINYVTGLAGALLLAFFMGAGWPEVWPALELKSLPLFMGGFLGVLFVLLSNVITPRLPAFTLTLFLICGQLAAGLVLDYFLLDQFSPGMLVGCALIAAGFWLNRPKGT